MGNYHHHQNPSAYNLDLNVISTVCNLYAADGLYAIDSTQHSPLIGFAYDGFPIYGAYAYKNVDGTGGITRMKSSFTVRNITVRNTLYTGTSVTAGPAVSATYPLGYFREDYQYNATSAATPDYLDIHNGRFCVTPEYPNGIYCYFATVDQNWNSAYPYVVGPTFYGVKTAQKVTSITESVSTYTPVSVGIETTTINEEILTIIPNPASDLIAIQLKGLNKEIIHVELIDITGKIILKSEILPGTTIGYLNTESVYDGIYHLHLKNKTTELTKKIVITH
jgi:hypothetical protein